MGVQVGRMQTSRKRGNVHAVAPEKRLRTNCPQKSARRMHGNCRERVRATECDWEGSGSATKAAAVALLVLSVYAAVARAQVPAGAPEHYTLQPGDACQYHAMCESDACWGGFCCATNAWCSSGQCTPKDFADVNLTAPYVADGARDRAYLLTWAEQSPGAGACVPTREDVAWRDGCLAIGGGCLQCICEPRDPLLVSDPERREDESVVELNMEERFDGTAVCRGRLDGPCVFVTPEAPRDDEDGRCVPDLMTRAHAAVPDVASPFEYLAEWPGFRDSILPGMQSRRRYVRPTVLNVGGYELWRGVQDAELVDAYGTQCPDVPLLANWPIIGLAGAWVLWALLWPAWYCARQCRVCCKFRNRRKRTLAWYEDVAMWCVRDDNEVLLWHGHYMQGHEFRVGVWAYLRPLCWMSLASLPALLQTALMANELFGPVGNDQRFGPLTFFPGLLSVVAYAAMLGSLFTDNKRSASYVYALTNECAVIVKVDWLTHEVGAVRRYDFTNMPDLELTKRSVVFKHEVKHIRKHPRGFREIALPVGFIDIRQPGAVYKMLLTVIAERAARLAMRDLIIEEVIREGGYAAAAVGITQEAEELEDQQTPWDFEETVFNAQKLADPAWVELEFVSPTLLTSLAQPQLHNLPDKPVRKRMNLGL